MKLRSIALALSLCVPLVSTSYAQQIPKAREQRLVALGKQLHVTGKQARQLMPILKAEEPQLQAIRNDRSLSRAERLRRLQAVHRQSDPQVKAILTPQQYQQLQVIRQQRRAQIMQAARSNPHQGGAARSQK
ncbi:MAG TPA: hypothetical protein VGF49_17960 [Candidatus Solibacter sp.]